LVDEVGGRGPPGGALLDGIVLELPVLRMPPRGGAAVIGSFPFAFSLNGCAPDDTSVDAVPVCSLPACGVC
jgi:hypothetical protein